MGKNEELSKRVYVSELKEYFHLKQITGDAESLKRWIIAPDVNRPGLELAGYIDTTDLKRVVIIGNKECGLLNTMDYATQKARFEFITDSYTPCIIMSNGNKTPAALEEIAKARNFPVFETDWQTYMAVQNVVAYLSRKLAPDTSMHGVMLNIYGKGVLLTGKSGIGKSELALELIRRGHFFVSDDRVEISRVQNGIDVAFRPGKRISERLLHAATESPGADASEIALELRFVPVDVAKMRIGDVEDRKRFLQSDLDMAVGERKPLVPETPFEHRLRLDRLALRRRHASRKSGNGEKSAGGAGRTEKIPAVHDCSCLSVYGCVQATCLPCV
jgi:hypothetical protein